MDGLRATALKNWPLERLVRWALVVTSLNHYRASFFHLQAKRKPEFHLKTRLG